LDFRHSQVLARKASREQSSSRLPQESICFAAFDLVNLYAKARGYPRADQSMQQRPAQAATQDPDQTSKGRMLLLYCIWALLITTVDLCQFVQI